LRIAQAVQVFLLAAPDNHGSQMEGSWAQASRWRRSELASAISNEILQAHRTQGGKGPTECRTYITHIEGDLVIVLLLGGYTQPPYEKGKWVDVRGTRGAFRERSMEGRFIRRIEELTGGEVIAFMSTSYKESPDILVEVFVLEGDVPLEDKPANEDEHEQSLNAQLFELQRLLESAGRESP
jgi:uncharacterized protein YbcI